MDKNSKIGVFDSGLGGLSVLHTLQTLLPNESFIYYGDSINAPYGVKSKDTVFELSKAICDSLIEKNVKAIVIACNTATSAAVERLRALYDIPIIGMEPAIKPALKHSVGQVAVLATEMTLKEEKFQRLVETLEDGYRIEKIPAPEWVDCVENHMFDETYVRKSVNNFLKENVSNSNAIVLGCTHFVFLKELISEYYNGKVEIFDGNMGTALQLKNTLMSRNLISEDMHVPTLEIINTKSSQYVEKSHALLMSLRKE